MKKILFIGLDYYNYPKTIKMELENLGYQVDYYQIEPRTLFYKTTRYIFKWLYRKSLDNYHSDIIVKTSHNNYDVVFFLTSHFFSSDNLKKLRETHSTAKFIAYHWDSIEQYDFLNTVQFFDRVLSFDRQDCIENGFEYLPLFASGIYKEIQNKKQDIDVYTVSSIVRPQRYLLIDKFRKFCLENQVSFYFYLKVTPVTYIGILRKGVIPKGVSFKTIDQLAMKDIVERSRAVLDVTNHSQSGLTMRIIENVYVGKKIITTNQNVKYEKFFNEEQIFLLNKYNIRGVKNFLKQNCKTKEYPELLIGNWLKVILNEKMLTIVHPRK